MAEEVGIVMKLYDEVSPSLKSITGNSKAFDKTMDELEESLKAYDKAQTTLTERMSNLKKAMAENNVQVKEAQKSYRKLKDEASKGALDAAIEEQVRLKREMNETRAAIDSNAAAYRALYQEAGRAVAAESRFSNRSEGPGLLTALGKAGILNMAGDAAGEWANALAGSALGSQGANLFSGALSGAVSGAAMGSLAGAPGMAVGAAIGGIAGLAGGAAQNFQNEDEAFKSYYNGLYEEQKEAASQRLESGIGTASQWELDAIAFNQLLGSGVGDRYLSDLREMAASTPMEYADLTGMSRALATGFGDAPERMLDLMTAIGDAGSAVGVTASDMTEMARAMSRMQSSGKATLEFLNIFQDRGVDVIGMLGEAMGKTQGEIYDMISKGEINGQNAATIIQQGMESAYGGAMDLMSETFSGLTSTLQDAITEINVATGEGYNPVRSQGMEEEIAAYGGALGDALKKLNEIEGENAARDQNMAERYTREALSAVLLGEKTSYIFDPEQQAALEEMRNEFIDASLAYENGSREAGDKMADLREEAITLATAAYDSSDRVLALEEAERDQIAAIRDNTQALNGWRSKYQTELEKEKGGASSRLNVTEVDIPEGIEGISPEKAEEIYRRTGGQVDVRRKDNTTGSGAAYGLSRVPRDGLYYLHQDERVQTAQEARSEKARTPLQITITGNTFGAGVTAEEIAQRLADAIELKLAAGVLS
ncbi:tape measure protein [Pseudoflavonifractor sp. DSM 107456]|uniref:Tape measure protein n=1 Tax=Pseudoflavonifractor gallinarum TaxID=2779352 RepID=A0ABR9RC14_9FIRM|nr:tape measure protein [Pseudoflavonifractor gallinarum]MBE5056222.1 tape measure protein [Pseudoflavonifractor gallinarum]